MSDGFDRFGRFLEGLDRLLGDESLFARPGMKGGLDGAMRRWSAPAYRDEPPTLVHFAAMYAERRIASLFNLAKTESPIEQLFWMALVFHAIAYTDGDVVLGLCDSDGAHIPARPQRCKQLEVCLQHRIGRYRVDFLLTGHDVSERGNRGRDVYPVSTVVVECDGHDFHERTKEQAKRDRQRDRDIQTAGFKVFRFTGSEINADPFKCAAEAFGAAFTPAIVPPTEG